MQSLKTYYEPRYRACIDAAISSKRRRAIQVQRRRSEGTRLAWDGHQWINQGTVALPRKKSKIKSIFYIAIANGASKEFVKFVFNEPEKEHGPFIIQYIGNYEISQAHGNAKKTQLDEF